MTDPQRATEPVSSALITPVLERLVQEGTGIGDHGACVDITSFAIKSEAGVILEIASYAAPDGATIEVGCASALSTLYIMRGRGARNGAGSSAHVIDPKQTTHWKNIGRRSIDAAGLSGQVTLHEAPAHEVLPRLLDASIDVGFAFIDGWHMLDYVMVEAFYIDAMLVHGGIIAVHDLWMPALQHFAAYWLSNRPYEAVTVQHGQLVPEPITGVDRIMGDAETMTPYVRRHVQPYVVESVLLLRKTGDDHRRWDDFSDFIEG